MENKLAVFGIMVAVLAVLIVPAAAQEYDIFHLVPENSNCHGTGCNTTVWVKLNTSHSDIDGFQAGIIFDPDVVNVTNVEKGKDDWLFWAWYVDDYGDKKYVKISGAIGPFGPGEVELGKMTLEGNNTGLSALHFGNDSELEADRTELANISGTLCGPPWMPCDTEDGTFACTETFTKHLEPGWNLISPPLFNNTDMTVANIIEESVGTDNYDALYKYNASTHSFVALSSSDTMENGVGYFIHITNPAGADWTYEGAPVTSMDVSMEQGLNMIGWLNCTKRINETSSLAGNSVYVARWNATSQKFEVYEPHAPKPETDMFNDFWTLERGEGYFVAAKTAFTLSESC